MRFAYLVLILALFGCINQVEPGPIQNDTVTNNTEPNVTPVQTGMFNHLLPCNVSSIGTIEVVGLENKTFRGKTYEFCHTKTRPPQPPEEGTGTPLFIESDNWNFLNMNSPEYQAIAYTVNRYTMSYVDGGLTFIRNNETCFSQASPVKAMDEYQDSELMCSLS